MATAPNDGDQIEEEMPEYLKIPPSDIQIGDQIGRGGYSTVHRASWRGKTCAAKVVRTTNVRVIQKEVAILSKLEHPNIVGCIGFSVDSSSEQGRCMILMELMDGDLRQLINERLKNKAKNAMPFSEAETFDILGQIAEGMDYLHQHGVFHGDLKASNVLVSHGDGGIRVKITDFGVSQMVKLDPAETPEEFITKKYFRGVVGTRGYQAPEVSSSSATFSDGYVSTTVFRAPERQPRSYEARTRRVKRKTLKRKAEPVFYSAKADTYCFAMTIYEVVSGRVPFESVPKADVPALVLRGVRPKLPHGLNLHLKALVERCWDEKPTERPDFKYINMVLKIYSVESKEQSRRKAPKCWGLLFKRSPRGMWK